MKTLWIISASFSIFYFILAVGQIMHIVYNHYFPKPDWTTTQKLQRQPYHWGQMTYLTIANAALLVIWLVILPMWHL